MKSSGAISDDVDEAVRWAVGNLVEDAAPTDYWDQNVDADVHWTVYDAVRDTIFKFRSEVDGDADCPLLAQFLRMVGR